MYDAIYKINLFCTQHVVRLKRVIVGFKDVKQKVIKCLNSGDVAGIIGRSRGDAYSSSPHHLDASVDVHIIKTTHSGKDWYVKWYFVDPSSVFISVHN